MRIDDLSQYGTYRLVFPLSINGIPVTNIIDAKFEIMNTAGVLVSLNMVDDGAEVYFDDSKLYVILNSINTVELSGNFTYEVWVKLADNNPYIVRNGAMTFNKTTVRF